MVIIVKHLELSTLKYISNNMLIYVKIFKLSDCLNIFIYKHLNASSICPTNIFKIRSKLCILELNIHFWHFVNKPSWHRELHVQQGKHTPNLQYIVFYYLFLFSLHVCKLVHSLFVELPTLNYLMCLENSLMFRKVRNHS